MSKYIKIKKNHSILPFKGAQTILRSSYQNLLTTTPKVLSQTVDREMGPWELGGNRGGKAALQWSRAGSVNGDQIASPVFNHIEFLFSDFKRGCSPPTVLDAPGNCLWTVTQAKKFPFFFFCRIVWCCEARSSAAMQSDSWGSVYSPVESLSPEIKRLLNPVKHCYGFPGGAVVKNPPANAGDTRDAGLVPGSGRCPEVGNGNPLLYSCLENSTDKGAWQSPVHGVAKS